MGHTLKAERGLIWQQQEDGGWHLVASCLAHAAGCEQDTYEMARLIADAPELKEQRDELLRACEAAHEWFRRFTRNSETVYEDESRMLVLLEAAIARVK